MEEIKKIPSRDQILAEDKWAVINFKKRGKNL